MNEDWNHKYLNVSFKHFVDTIYVLLIHYKYVIKSKDIYKAFLIDIYYFDCFMKIFINKLFYEVSVLKKKI